MSPEEDQQTADAEVLAPSGNALSVEIAEPSAAQKAAGIVGVFTHSSTDGTTQGAVARSDQGLVISHLAVTPAASGSRPGSVTARLLRDIPVGRILDSARTWLAVNEMRAAAAASGDDGPFLMVFGGLPTRTADEIIAAHSPAQASPGRVPLPDELLREVAEGYISESAPGRPRGAVKRLAAALERPEDTVSRWVARARREGWLGPGAAGREGAEPGPKLVAARRIGGTTAGS
ncbi:hypothetical protein ACFV0B_06790 [Streptomyces xanthophaeus]|uniref:hypothetical protein n=1 Tax=Streptomyces xanthophaeus TaxID=67385 RepID=UPI0036790ABB